MKSRPHIRRNDNPEERFHIDVARYLRVVLTTETWWTTIPTTRASRTEGAKLKAKGYAPGTPDILLIYAGYPYWLELKAPKGYASDDQIKVGKNLYEAGCTPPALVRTLDEVQAWLLRWGIPVRARIPGRTA